MATTPTTNLGLIKPDYSEPADVAIINDNMDTIDSVVSEIKDKTDAFSVVNGKLCLTYYKEEE